MPCGTAGKDCSAVASQVCAGSLVADALAGYSSTVLCYGQTGALLHSLSDAVQEGGTCIAISELGRLRRARDPYLQGVHPSDVAACSNGLRSVHEAVLG